MDAIVLSASTGYFPAAVSPDSITASQPSYTEEATSLTSALVGRGLRIILSNICVAVITGRPMDLHSWIISFWYFNAQIAARHHNGIRCLCDFLNVYNGLMAFDLADDLDAFSAIFL